MSTGRGRGGNATTRSPPRMAEDRDAMVVLRATRGTGLPPQILSSYRPRGGFGGRRGGAKGGQTGDGYTVRPHGGSVPPWAKRERAADTYRPDYRSPPPVDKGQDIDSPPRAEREPPSRPKWEREREKQRDSIPPPPPEYLSSSPVQPVSRNDMNGTSMGYSAGPSHQRWMRPEAEAGPSRYSVDEPLPDPANESYSAASSPMTSRTQYDHPLESSTSEMHKSIRWEAATTDDEHMTRPPDLSETNSEEERSAIQNEKEDTYVDPPTRTSRKTSTPRAKEKAVEVDIKPDISAVMEAEVPVILEEDREDGVLAVKRNLVLQCYEKNPTVRSAARKAFRVQKTAELSAIGRIVQHVLWRDDGVGVQWKKARSTRSPTKTAEPALAAPNPPPIIDPSPPKRPKTPTAIEPKSTVPPSSVTVKIEPGLSTPPNIPPKTKTKSLPQTPAQDSSRPRAQPEAGPSRRSPIKIALPPPPPPAQKPVVPNTLLNRSEPDTDTNKRKAVEEPPIPKAPKPPKQPKVDQPSAADTLSAAQHREKLDRQAEARRNLAAEQEANAMNEPVGTSNTPKKKKGKSKGDPLGAAQQRRKQKNREKLAQKIAQRNAAKATEEQQGPGSAPTTSNAVPRTADGSTGKEKGKARDTIDLTVDDPVVPGLTGSSAAKEKPVTKLVLRFTKHAEANQSQTANPKPPSAPIKRAYSPSRPAPPPAAPSSSRPAAIVRPPPSAPAAMKPKPKPIPNPIPPSRPITASARPQPIRPPTSIRPPPVKTLPIRPPPKSTSAARPPPQSASVVRPAPARVIPLGPSHPLPTAEASRPPPQPPVQPQYHAQVAGGSYTERQALAALAARAPQVGQQARPPITKFTPRPAAGSVPARPPVPRPPIRPINASRPTSSSSPLGGIDTVSSTPRYEELRRQLSSKMEEIDNWTSMLTDLPDRAEMTQRQIDRTRQECFELQKQMREEKEKAR